MDYSAGLNISMEETHVCVVDQDGAVVHESKTVSTAQAIAVELAKASSCCRVVFETGRMAPIRFHGVARTRISRGLHRKPASLPGAQLPDEVVDFHAREPRNLRLFGAREIIWLASFRLLTVRTINCLFLAAP